MSPEVFEFGDVTVDLRRVEVRRAGEAVPLEPKSFDVLRHLLENSDRLVTKEELLDVVWKGTFVTPNVLTRAVAQLRKALGDDAFEARYIETVARRGYRFIALDGVGANGDSRAVAAALEESAPPSAAGPRPGRPRRVGLVLTSLALAVAFAAVAGLWVTARNRADWTGDTSFLTPRRLTAARDTYANPAVSPDGHAVAYVSDRSGSEEIYVASLAPGSRELAITSDGDGNVEPAFSADGQWLAYRSRKRRGIWVVPSTGGAPRQVAEFGSEPQWSADSQTIVFTSRGQDGSLSSQAQLWTVRRDGDPPLELTRLGSPPGGHLNPGWSHDGRLIAFRVGRHEANELWVVEAGGGAPWRVAAPTSASAPRFSPDNRALYWIGKTPERNDCVMRLKLDGAGRADGDPERLLTFQGEGAWGLSIARNGTAIYLWSRLSVNLFAIDVDAEGVAGPPRQLTFDEGAINRYPDYAPTGRIAYEQVMAGRPTTAWQMDDDGQNKEPLSAGLPAAARTPQWDADGKRVLALIEPGAQQQPYFGWIDVATRRLTRIPIASEGAVNLPKLSPDGRQLAFHLVAADGSVNTWVQRLDDGARRQVTFDREAMSYPIWSPDGRWLVVQIKRGEDSQLGVVSAEGGPVEPLTSGPGVRWAYTLSPDGDRIAFSAGASANAVWNVSTVSRRTKRVKQLTHFTTTGGARFPAWAPRGDRIVFSSPQTAHSLWTLRLP
jgi:Tol biopolymer transport system component/DNA-binding winged helix-turn-helix (wHTH) protein